MSKIKHIGRSANRLDPRCDNPREVAFAREWQDANDRGDTLSHLLSDTPNKKDGYVSDRDREVAATIMQWLGSNCGMCLIRDVIEKCPEVRAWFYPDKMMTDFAPTCVKRDPPKTPEQCALIALAEYEYWRTQERVDENIAAMAAAANIYAAITTGMMAPWHARGAGERKTNESSNHGGR